MSVLFSDPFQLGASDMVGSPRVVDSFVTNPSPPPAKQRREADGETAVVISLDESF